MAGILCTDSIVCPQQSRHFLIISGHWVISLSLVLQSFPQQLSVTFSSQAFKDSTTPEAATSGHTEPMRVRRVICWERLTFLSRELSKSSQSDRLPSCRPPPHNPLPSSPEKSVPQLLVTDRCLKAWWGGWVVFGSPGQLPSLLSS